MKVLHVYFLLFLLLGSAFSLSAEVIEASSYSDVEAAFSIADSNTLGVFSVQSVLTYPANPAFQKGNWRENQQFVKILLKQMCESQRWLFANFSSLQTDEAPLDINEWSVIQRLQNRLIKVVAMVDSMTGVLDGVYLQERQYEQLKKLKIDLAQAFSNIPSFYMNALPFREGRYPCFYKGIFFTNGLGCKGDLLTEFFRCIEWRPTKIIFVDASLPDLTAAEKILKLYDPDIQFLGVHLTLDQKTDFIDQEAFQAEWKKVLQKVAEHERKRACDP